MSDIENVPNVPYDQAKWHRETNGGKTIKGLPAQSNPYRNRIVRLGIRLEAAQQKVGRLEAAAARRVTPTGLVGAEDFAAGQAHIGYPRREPAGSIRRNVAMGQGGSVGIPKQEGRLTHTLTGANIHTGHFRNDVPRIIADDTELRQSPALPLSYGGDGHASTAVAPWQRSGIRYSYRQTESCLASAEAGHRNERARAANSCIGHTGASWRALFLSSASTSRSPASPCSSAPAACRPGRDGPRKQPTALVRQ
jgi:hypothetical protein